MTIGSARMFREEGRGRHDTPRVTLHSPETPLRVSLFREVQMQAGAPFLPLPFRGEVLRPRQLPRLLEREKTASRGISHAVAQPVTPRHPPFIRVCLQTNLNVSIRAYFIHLRMSALTPTLHTLTPTLHSFAYVCKQT